MDTSSKKVAESEVRDPHPGFRFEAVEDIRNAAQGIIAGTREEKSELDTIPFRPIHSPPMALLCILDDGSDDGEWVRIRGDSLVIGRSEGNIIVSRDEMMSSRHAEICRKVVKGGFRWYLTDLNSTNGTFVRVADTPINHGQEILLGSHRFRFNAAPQGAALLAETQSSSSPPATRGWQAAPVEALVPSLIEITKGSDTKQFYLKSSDVRIGRNPKQCSVVIADDMMISPCHCRIYRDDKGQWHLENAGARNGTWVRIRNIGLPRTAQFQLGEQRFFVKVLS